MFDDEETDPERRPPAGQGNDQRGPSPSFPQGSTPSLAVPGNADEWPAKVDRVELCWLGGSPVEVEVHGDAVAMVLFKALRVRGTPEDAAAIGRALLRAADRARRS